MKTMRFNSLKIKVSLYLMIALSIALVAFVALIIHREQKLMEEDISRQAVLLAEVVVRSTRHAMMINKRDIAAKIITDISKQNGVQRVRVINSDGTIIHSSNEADFGRTVERKDEPCVGCHLTSEPLEHIPDEKRWRIASAPDGSRSLVTMTAIRNESSCSSAACHEHRASQKVLGVVDVAYSLDELDKVRANHTAALVLLCATLVVAISVSTALLLQRQIYLPLRDLATGAAKITGGELDHAIPVRNDDEFGHLAAAFNHMRLALKTSRAAERRLVETLESKVEERTRELRTAEAAAAHGEKLASVGLLASGIAHELNNPLTGVLTFTSLLRKKTPDGTQDAEDLDLVIGETKRCASIIRRLLDFAREKVPVKGYVDLNELIEDTVRLVDRQASLQNIEIKLRLSSDLPKIWCDADLIKQVILNILVNAQQAITGSGRIGIESRMTASPAGAAPRAEIIIADTGCGIPPGNLERIFDPFFTSKEVGKGTGLGLSVSYGIIRAHGGEITVESTVDVGTTFHVFLPVMATDDDSGSKSS